jgi:ribosomal protein S18 acetylase RimI-like enzyme
MRTDRPATWAVRAYHPADWPELCRIHDAARRQELAASVGEAAFQPLEEVGVSEGLFDGAVVVGIVGTRIVGFAAFTPGELTWLYVDPARQGEGHGRALLRHVLAGHEAGPEVSTEVLVGNDVALQLYRSEGFAIVAQKSGRLSGNDAFAASAFLLRWVQPADND